MVQTLIEREVQKVFAAGIRNVINATPERSFDYILKDPGGREITRAAFASKDIDGVVGQIIEGKKVVSYEMIVNEELLKADRREQREEKFANTIDKITPVWFEDLTEDQKARVKAFRAAWLDYPTSGNIPDTYVLNRGTSNETEVSTDIRDIFPEA